MTETKNHRHVAFLRAINVGGRRVTMAALKVPFEAMGLERVSTFIASGNVIFDTPEGDAAALEARIERALREALGYEVETFVRAAEEVAEIAAARHFPTFDADPEAFHVYVAFTRSAIGQEAAERVKALEGQVEVIRVEGREVFWAQRRGSEVKGLSGAELERALGGPATVRNVNTARRIAASHPAPR